MNKVNTGLLVSFVPDYWGKKIKIPDIQREDTAWSQEQKALLLDSLYNDFDIPKFYFRQDTGTASVWWLIDGQQRPTAILEFLNNKFPLGTNSTLPEHTHKKYYRELSPEDATRIKQRSLDFVILTCSDDEEEDLFLRLNKGTPLNAAEKRHAIVGDVRELAIKLAEHKFLKTKTNYAQTRYAGHAVAAQIIQLYVAGEPCEIKGKQLNLLYESKKRFPEKSSAEKEIRKVLNKLDKMFEKQERYLRKYNVTSLFLFISELIKHYSLSGISDAELYKFVDDFERERRENNQKTEDDANFDMELNAYTLACLNSPDRKDSVRTRHTILLKKFLQLHHDLEPKDPKRDFSIEQKEVIYLLCEKMCQGGAGCPVHGRVLPFEDCEFDHIKEHTDGGRTTIENGQVLCAVCHAKKTTRSSRARKS